MAADLGGPEALLAQIRTLLEQYLAMGEDTPVAMEAQALMGAIDATGGEMAPEGAGMMPPEAGLEAPMDAMSEEPLPPELGMELGPDEQGYSGTSMDEAAKGASAFLKKRNQR